MPTHKQFLCELRNSLVPVPPTAFLYAWEYVDVHSENADGEDMTNTDDEDFEPKHPSGIERRQEPLLHIPSSLFRHSNTSCRDGVSRVKTTTNSNI